MSLKSLYMLKRPEILSLNQHTLLIYVFLALWLCMYLSLIHIIPHIMKRLFLIEINVFKALIPLSTKKKKARVLFFKI